MEEDSKEMGVTSYLIILLVTLVIVLVFFSQAFSAWKDNSEAKICRQSVKMHALAHVGGVETFEDLVCPPKELLIEEEINEKIAYEMAECAWKFGAGEEWDLFGGDGTYCALCTQIKFQGAGSGPEIKDFRNYLAEEQVPKRFLKDKNVKQTYLGYLVEKPTGDIQELDQPSLRIDTGKDYAIMFVYSKNRHISKVWAALGTTGATTVIGGLWTFPDPSLTKIAGIIAVAAYTGALSYDMASEKPADWQRAVILLPNDAEALSKLECTQMPVKQMNK